MPQRTVLLMLLSVCWAISAHAQDDGGDYFGGGGDGSDSSSGGYYSAPVVDLSAWSGSLGQDFLNWQPAPLQVQNGPSLADQISSFGTSLQTSFSNAVLNAAQSERDWWGGVQSDPTGTFFSALQLAAAVVAEPIAVGLIGDGMTAAVTSTLIEQGTTAMDSAYDLSNPYDAPALVGDLGGIAGYLGLDNVENGLKGASIFGDAINSASDFAEKGAQLFNPTAMTFSVEPVTPLDSAQLELQLSQLRLQAAQADQALQDAQAALNAQKAPLNTQQQGTDGALEDLQLPAASTSIPWTLGNPGQSQRTTTTVDPIEGSWVISSNNGGCDAVEGTSGLGIQFGIVRQGPNTFLTSSQGIITEIAPGIYVSRPRGTNRSIQSWENVIRVNGSTLQVSETIHYSSPLMGNRVCTELITARKQ